MLSFMEQDKGTCPQFADEEQETQVTEFRGGGSGSPVLSDLPSPQAALPWTLWH